MSVSIEFTPTKIIVRTKHIHSVSLHFKYLSKVSIGVSDTLVSPPQFFKTFPKNTSTLTEILGQVHSVCSHLASKECRSYLTLVPSQFLPQTLKQILNEDVLLRYQDYDYDLTELFKIAVYGKIKVGKIAFTAHCCDYYPTALPNQLNVQRPLGEKLLILAALEKLNIVQPNESFFELKNPFFPDSVKVVFKVGQKSLTKLRDRLRLLSIDQLMP